LSKRAVQYYIKHKIPGRIISIVSQSAFNGTVSGHAHYAAAKAGVVGFTRSLALEVAKHGINVTAVAPGMIKTSMAEEKLIGRLSHYMDKIPLGRIAEPREVGYAVIFLASKMGDYITGATIDVTGGLIIS